MQDSRRVIRQGPRGLSTGIPRFRRRLFTRLLIILSVLLVVTLATAALVLRVSTSPWAVLPAAAGAGLATGVLIALAFSRRLETRVLTMIRVIEAGSPQLGEELARETSDRLFAEVLIAWQSAVRSLQESWVEKQEEAKRNYQALAELIRMMAKAVDERATYLRGHSERVASYASAIADKMGLTTEQVEEIRLAALLHDIGTLGIEDYLVTKDAPLAPDEFEIVKAHTVKGAAILRPIEMLHPLIPGVELHHESLDGMGYPYGLKGDDIPLMARIIAVADSFDAMTTPRPYQAAMNAEYVLEIMKRLAGTRYDPAVVNALMTLVRSGTVEVKQIRIPVAFRMRRPVVEIA